MVLGEPFGRIMMGTSAPTVSLLAAQASCTQHIKKEAEDMHKYCVVDSRFMGCHWYHPYVAATFPGYVAKGILRHSGVSRASTLTLWNKLTACPLERTSFLFFITSSLRWNSHAAQVTHLHSTTQCFLVRSQNCAPITTILEYSHSPQKKPSTHQQSLPILPTASPWQPPVSLLSVSIDLASLDIACKWNLHYVTFCVWLLCV